MPTKPKSKSKSANNSKESLEIEVGSIHEELEVPVSKRTTNKNNLWTFVLNTILIMISKCSKLIRTI